MNAIDVIKTELACVQRDCCRVENQCAKCDLVLPVEEIISAYEKCITLLSEHEKLENKIADIKANCDLAIEGRDVKVMELEKENKLLGKRCNQLLADKGKLTDELDKWKTEWNEQVVKANEEGFERTKQTIQLSKAKELLKNLLSAYISYADSFDDRDNEIVADAEQFLNSEVEK